MTNPCRTCDERTPGCHTRCPYYADWDKQNKERREQIKAERIKDNGFTCYKRETVDKRIRR